MDIIIDRMKMYCLWVWSKVRLMKVKDRVLVVLKENEMYLFFLFEYKFIGFKII